MAGKSPTGMPVGPLPSRYTSPVTVSRYMSPTIEPGMLAGGGPLPTNQPVPRGPAPPAGPAAPIGPWMPSGPIGPVAPAAPAGPAGPVGPAEPAEPAGPTGPVIEPASTHCVVSVSQTKRTLLRSGGTVATT